MYNFTVELSREAIYDVADISDYIEQSFGLERANRFIDEIDLEIAALGTDYKMYSGTGIFYRKKMILKKLFSPSIIFYFVDEAKEIVYVIRILRHEQNWQKILRENISYTF